MVAADVDGLLMAGRCISGDFVAHSSYRVTGNSVPMGEAAERLGVTVEVLQRDLEEVTSRAFYHPAGGADEIQILLEADNLKIYAYKKFDRPTRLSGREMLSLALGLRAAASEAEAEASEEILNLAHRIEMELAVSSTERPPSSKVRWRDTSIDGALSAMAK